MGSRPAPKPPGREQGGPRPHWLGPVSPEYVFGAPTWSWTLGAVSATCPAIGTPEPRPYSLIYPSP